MKPARLHDLLDAWAVHRPRGEFVVAPDGCLTYSEAAAMTDRIAGGFVQAGLLCGDRVAILSGNRVSFVLAYFAASRAGVALVPLNHRQAVRELVALLADAEPRAVIADDAHLEIVESMRANLPFVERFLASGSVPAGWAPLVPPVADRPRSGVDGDAAVYHMYTSGTTGSAKAAVLSHAAVLANVRQIARAMPMSEGDRSLVVAPLFHAAVVPSVFATVAQGGSLYLLDRFDPAAVVAALSRRAIRTTVLVPSMLQACLAEVPGVDDRRYEALRTIYYGASPISEATLRRAMEVFRCGFVQSYGMTEAAQALTFLSPGDHRRAITDRPELLLSAGRRAWETAIRIVDGDDQLMATGTAGEIVARGPQLMREYWRRPAESGAALRDGWLHTGDAGYLDDAGYLYVRDRLKDVIVTGGENVAPRVVEEALCAHPAVTDAAVIGVPDQRWGEAVKAFVILDPACAATPAELIQSCRERLAGFELPRSIDLVDELPRTATGKVLRRVLRERHWSDHPRRVAGP